MKSVKQFLDQAETLVKAELWEEGEASTTTADVATPDVPMFGGARVFKVDTATFMKARMGKKKFDRWYNYVDEDNGGADIRSYGLKNPKAPIVLQDSATGAMMYLRYGKQ